MFQDITFACRSLVRVPLFTAGAVITLALGIGVNSTIFTLANGALFRPLPGIAGPDRLAWLAATSRDSGREMGLSYPDYLDVRDATADVFSDSAAFLPTPLSLGSGGEPQRIQGHVVTGSYFSTLGVVPAAGRLFDASDDRRGSVHLAAVISYQLWQQRFGGDAAALDAPIVVNGRTLSVIGIAPRGFRGPALGEGADLWIPMALWPEVHPSGRGLLDERGASWLLAIARLRPGMSPARARASIFAASTRLAQAYPETNRDRSVSLTAIGVSVSPQGRAELVPLSGLLLAITGLVLMIACANIANLLLARGAARAGEMGIRAALGASRARLVRQLLTESALLATAGAIGGLLLSSWGADLVAAALPADDFQGLAGATDRRVLAFTLAATAVSVVLFGLVPALSSTRRALLPSLRHAGGAGRRTRAQSLFVVAQLALSLVLLLGAGLSARALQHAASIDPGFDPHGVFTASYDLVLQNYEPARRDAFRRELLTRVGALPGVDDVSLANVAPLSGTMIGMGVATAQPNPREAMSYVNGVGPGYFQTLRLPILKGRAIGPGDTRSSAAVAVVNETLARRLWGGDGPIGQVLRLGDVPVEVVGVARDAKYDEATEDPRPFLYTALAQQTVLDREVLIARARLAPAAFADAVRSIARELDPAMPLFDVTPLEATLAGRADKQRAISLVVGGFGILALLLAAIGLYGVMAYTVSVRRRELGVRLALGATPGELVGLIARDGLRLAAAGVALGSLLALPLARVLGALVFGVAIGDAAAFAGVCAVMIGVAVVAAALPARRATRLDPVVALRAE